MDLPEIASFADSEIRAMRAGMLRWYAPRRLSLPWRRTSDPYATWVSEVMLQQTRIATVVPAYESFLRRFPTIEALAAAAEEDVLAAWSGLGYYTRARSLHRAAGVLVARGSAAFPADPDEARSLPGVGPYTVAAVLSIAYGRPLAAVDGNVVRVLSRVARLPPPDAKLRPHATLAERLLDPRRPGDWNQALMEIGQTVCVPREPRCHACPLRRFCRAHAAGDVDRFPQRANRRKVEKVSLTATVLHDGRGHVLLERGAFVHLRHLWLPWTGSVLPGWRTVEHGSVRHAILHRSFDVRVLAVRTSMAALRRLVTAGAVQREVFAVDDVGKIGRSSLLTKVLRKTALMP